MEGASVKNQDYVCNVCGNEGYRHCLVTCFSCGDRRHVYCMKEVSMEVPKDWQCDDCQRKTLGEAIRANKPEEFTDEDWIYLMKRHFFKDNFKDHRVCETRGVEGNKQCLIACSKCGGHQHIYCMQTTLMELPEEWQCDECQETTQDQLNVVHSIEASDKEVENIIPISSEVERATDACMENLLLVSSAEAKQHEDSDILAGEDVNEVDEFFVCPSKYCSWRGTFMIIEEGFVDFKCHLEAYTLPTTTKRISKISSEMPEEIQLTVTTRTTLETNMFPTPPTKDDIGLFFFCKEDLGCTRYLQILEQLDANDCVMKGMIHNMELIVLSSKLLPLGSQYWLGKPFMWAVFGSIQNYKNICEFNATMVQPDPIVEDNAVVILPDPVVVQPDPVVVQPDPMVVQSDSVPDTGRIKKKSSRLGPDPVPATGRIKKKSSRFESDPVPVAGRIKKKSSRVGPDPVPATGRIKKKSSGVGLDPVPVTGRIKKKSSRVSPDPVPITGKIKKKSSRVGEKSSSLPPLTPTMNYVAPPPPLPPTLIINYIVSVPRIGDRKVKRGSRSCWDRNRMA